MKSIINGLRYDTEKAVLIGTAGYEGSVNDLQWWEASLYRTPRSGRYFLAGKGGPMTRWSRSVDSNSWTGGHGIHPMSREEAMEWSQQYLATDEVEAAFGVTLQDA